MMATQIKLMADYQCHPLWWDSDDQVGNIDPSTLPLSKQTIERLDRWAATFDSWMNLDDPGSDSQPDPAQVEAFKAEGRRLVQLLRQELSPQFEVVYQVAG